MVLKLSPAPCYFLESRDQRLPIQIRAHRFTNSARVYTDMASMKTKRKQWAADSMEEACITVKNEQMGLREAAQKYNVPIETLRRRTAGLVSLDCQIFNADESGVSIVRRPSKVVAQIGRHNVPSLTSADNGKTHTILACVSASGQVIPPFIVIPRKQPVPKNLRVGAYPNTVFNVSDNGWITKELFFE